KDQANYKAAHMVAHRLSDPDVPALMVGNHILSVARLWQRLREKDGLSYGAGSSFTPGELDPAGAWQFSASCNPANMPRVRQAMAEEIARILKDGVTPQELADAKKAFLADRTFSDGEIVGMLASELTGSDNFAAYTDRLKK